jgi:hypothetical protein
MTMKSMAVVPAILPTTNINNIPKPHCQLKFNEQLKAVAAQP